MKKAWLASLIGHVALLFAIGVQVAHRPSPITLTEIWIEPTSAPAQWIAKSKFPLATAPAPAQEVPSAPSSTARPTASPAVWLRAMARIKTELIYPESARRSLQEGRAQLHATIDAQGNLTQLRTIQSAGDEALDRAAIEAVKRAAPYPELANQSVSIPLTFRIR